MAQTQQGAAKAAPKVVTERGAPGDDILAIDGIAEGYAKTLRDSKVDSLFDIADWTDDDVARFSEALRAGNRIKEQDWIGQAKAMTGQVFPARVPEPEPEPSRAPAQASSPAAPPTTPAPSYGNPVFAQFSRDELEALAAKLLLEREPPIAPGGPKLEAMVDEDDDEAPAPVARAGVRVRRRLNRNKKFGFVQGDHFGAHWYQKGAYFDHEGREIPFRREGQPFSPAEIAAMPVEDEEIVNDADDVSLDNWYQGLIDYPLALVQKAVLRRYRRRFETVKELRAFLHMALRGNF